MCVYQPYTPRERHPLFFRYPLVVPHPSQVVGSLQRQRLPPQPRSCLIAPASRSSQQELPNRKRKYTESTQQQPKPSNCNGNI